MKNLSNLIKGLQIIEKEENEEVEFNCEFGCILIGNPLEYSDKQKENIEKLGFKINTEYECFEYDLN